MNRHGEPALSRVQRTACPACQAPLDAATHLVDLDPPKPGDLTVCLYCSTPLWFLESGGLRELTPDELVAAIADPEAGLALSTAIRVTREYQARAPKLVYKKETE